MAVTRTGVDIATPAGADADGYTSTAGRFQQALQLAPADSATEDVWATSTTARATPIPADDARVAVHMFNDSTSNVWISVTGTNPTVSSGGWKIPPYGELDLEPAFVKLNVRMIADGSGTGNLRTTLGVVA
jgi:hypothetical protein